MWTMIWKREKKQIKRKTEISLSEIWNFAILEIVKRRSSNSDDSFCMLDWMGTDENGLFEWWIGRILCNAKGGIVLQNPTVPVEELEYTIDSNSIWPHGF